jgi:hypothetical protein
MGGRAKELFESAGIDMILGVEGQDIRARKTNSKWDP